jgi:hypothetical protein
MPFVDNNERHSFFNLVMVVDFKRYMQYYNTINRNKLQVPVMRVVISSTFKKRGTLIWLRTETHSHKHG